MTNTTLSTPSADDLSMRDLFTPRAILVRLLIVATVLGIAILPKLLAGGGTALTLPHPHLHWPHWHLLAQAALMIRIHVAAAVTALVVGAVLLAGVKGSTRHRQLGWAWVIAMVATAGTSLFIKVINPGHWSFIHFLSGWVLIAVPMGVVAIRRRNIRLHRKLMTGVFIGGLLIAGAFTFAPGRLMYAVFFG